MEFPQLGNQCSESSCKKLDFLPVKCDACENIFCHEHMSYISHSCSSAYKKDVQVPVCPLCNTPIPVRRGEPPDIAVSAHIDTDCQSDPAKNKRKVFTNKCSMKGCKGKEIVRVVCNECTLNFCLRHRHTADHNCQGKQAAARNRAAQAAAARLSKPTRPTVGSATAAVLDNMSDEEIIEIVIQMAISEEESHKEESHKKHNLPEEQIIAATDEEALEIAIQLSIAEEESHKKHNLPEEQMIAADAALARALMESERDMRQPITSNTPSNNRCSVS